MTFSLVGRCARTGMLGAAVTTSSLAVGSRCPFVRPGVGAALTQNRTDPRLGPLALELLARGGDVDHAMAATVAATPHHGWRQLALIDARGRTATFTGAHVRDGKGEAHGRDCAAIANIVRDGTIPAAMVAAFEAEPDDDLAGRLVRALQAGLDAGGEFKPLVSAALLVAHEAPFPYVDLRVDRHPEPIAELASLWQDYRAEAAPYVVRALDPDAAVNPADLPATPSGAP